jgi:hypothetical protein
MDITELKNEVKKIALDSGAKLFGVGSRERLKDAPPSGDMDYCLPGAQSCIIWAYPNTMEALENYFSKKERMSIKVLQDIGYVTGWKTAVKIANFIEDNSDFNAIPIIPNGKYRKTGSFSNFLNVAHQYPPFSLRYGAVAAGLGRLGWSGNLVTKEFGGSLYLDGVLTTAPLDPDPLAEENNCNGCKICQKVCTTGYVSKDVVEDRQEVIIAGRKEVYGKRGTYAKCGIGCAGWTGLSEDGTWSTWTPDHICLKTKSDEFWQDSKGQKELMKTLLLSENTPLNIRKFNKTVATSFAKVAKTENVGLRPIEDTNPRCGNCNFICVADPKKRAELNNMLKNSGKVFLDEKGREIVKKIDKNGQETIYFPPTWIEYKKVKEIE